MMRKSLLAILAAAFLATNFAYAALGPDCTAPDKMAVSKCNSDSKNPKKKCEAEAVGKKLTGKAKDRYISICILR